ncbi:hypothetical protein M3Y97_00457200 [Aphelenchoides bicaudatus]|nr:hypothetical protein M3Y97_00457200 [Aphelenchoides bicaudatus]
MMPRVVENQLEVFRSDQFLKELAQGVQIKYGGCQFGKDEERHKAFKKNCDEKRLPIVSLHFVF